MMAGTGFGYGASITEAILGFAAFLRSHGWVVGAREVEETLRTAAAGAMAEKRTFRYALKSIFCCTKENADQFDYYFDEFWGKGKLAVGEKVRPRNSSIIKQPKNVLVFMGINAKNQVDDENEQGKTVSGASMRELLRKTDFAKVSEVDSAQLDALAEELWQQMNRRMVRKEKRSFIKGRLDIRKTIRSNISNGGLMASLEFKGRKTDRRKLVVLLDVSGSMDKYSFYLLRFILSLRTYFKNIQVFIFSTKLVCITEQIKEKNLERTLTALAMETNQWSGGTKIGDCIKSFNQEHARKVLNGRSATLILSDGLDTGEPAELAEELERIRRRTRQLIWLNPLLGMDGYQPLARGMKAALTKIDVFRPAHNLDSLLKLEKILADV